MDSRGYTPAERAFRVIASRCLGQVLDLDLFQYCACGCLTCPHEGRRGAPSRQSTFEAYGRTRQAFDGPDALGMNPSLLAQVEAWLEDTPPRSRPPFVTVGLATEPLPGFAESTALLGRALEALLTGGVGISLRTRRNLPDPILDLFGQHAERVRITIPLPLLDNTALGRWEPGTASATQRLFTIQRLRAARLAVQVAVKPLIPFVNDDDAHLKRLVSALCDLGVKKIAASFLRLTPAVRRRLEQGSPPVSARLIVGAYLERGPQGDALLRLPLLDRRRTTYERLEEIARGRGARLALCRCADPDLGRDSCLLWPEDLPRGEATRTPGAAGPQERWGGSPDGTHPRRPASQVGFTELLRK